jgi:predicted DNA-binding transcriptional regulator AlpA
MPIKKLLDQQCLAQILGLNPKTIARWRSAGKIPQPLILVGDRPYWSTQQIERWQSNENSLFQQEEHCRTLSDTV